LMAFGGPFMSLMTYYPTFLSQERGFSMTQAGMLTGIIWITGVPVGPLAGWFSDTIGSRKWVILAGFVFFLPVFVLAFLVSGGMVWVMVILLGFVSGIIPPVILAAAPEALNDVKVAGIGMAILTLGMKLGLVVGPPIFGGLIESIGWTHTAYVYTSFIILGMVCAGMYKKAQKASSY